MATVLKPPRKLQPLSKAINTQLIACSLLAFALTVLTLFMPNLNVLQQFCLRIFIGLGAASIAALIPGFFEIQVGWLKTTLRASGAIAVFVLIYVTNPPAIQQFATLQELTGDWDYECTISKGAFSHGGIQHGGTANFQIVRTKYGDALSINGTREWTRKDNDSERPPAENSSIWQTQGYNFTGDDRLMYQYVTTEKGTSNLGTSTLKIVKDSSGNITLVGSFQRTADAQNMYGTVTMKKNITHNAGSSGAKSIGEIPGSSKNTNVHAFELRLLSLFAF